MTRGDSRQTHQVTQQVLECLARSRVYKVLSQALGPPDLAILKGSVRSEAVEDLARMTRLLSPEIIKVTLEFAQTLENAQLDAENIRRDYEHSFSESGSAHIPLYETEYTSPHVFAKTQMMADIAGFYRAFGMRSNHSLGERPDHPPSKAHCWLRIAQGTPQPRSSPKLVVRLRNFTQQDEVALARVSIPSLDIDNACGLRRTLTTPLPHILEFSDPSGLNPCCSSSYVETKHSAKAYPIAPDNRGRLQLLL